MAKKSVRTALLTINGYNAGSGAWPTFPMKFPFAMPFLPFWEPAPTLPVVDTPREIPLCGSARLQHAGPARLLKFAGPGSETLELVQFDPTVGDGWR